MVAHVLEGFVTFTYLGPEDRGSSTFSSWVSTSWHGVISQNFPVI